MTELKTTLNKLTVNSFSFFCENHKIEHETDHDISYKWCDHCGIYTNRSWSSIQTFWLRSTDIQLRINNFDL